jgi:hypothetical protein
MTLHSTVHVLNIYYQPLPDKIYKSQLTLIPNLFEGTVYVIMVSVVLSQKRTKHKYPLFAFECS